MPGLFFQPIDRRKFLKLSGQAIVAGALAGTAESSGAAERDRSKYFHMALLSDTHMKSVVATIAAAGRPQTCNHFIVYPATGALEIASAYRHEATEALQRVVRNMQASFYFDLGCLDCRELTLEVSNIFLRVHSQFCSYFDKLIGV